MSLEDIHYIKFLLRKVDEYKDNKNLYEYWMKSVDDHLSALEKRYKYRMDQMAEETELE